MPTPELHDLAPPSDAKYFVAGVVSSCSHGSGHVGQADKRVIAEEGHGDDQGGQDGRR